jgi:hypothetical protein
MNGLVAFILMIALIGFAVGLASNKVERSLVKPQNPNFDNLNN